jgi:hypothetical protein
MTTAGGGRYEEGWKLDFERGAVRMAARRVSKAQP